MIVIYAIHIRIMTSMTCDTFDLEDPILFVDRYNWNPYCLMALTFLENLRRIIVMYFHLQHLAAYSYFNLYIQSYKKRRICKHLLPYYFLFMLNYTNCNILSYTIGESKHCCPDINDGKSIWYQQLSPFMFLKLPLRQTTKTGFRRNWADSESDTNDKKTNVWMNNETISIL